MNEPRFTEYDFSEDELLLLKITFNSIDAVVETQRADNYDTHWPNVLFSLKEKLGIGDVV